jgi:hypothetical protein
MVAGADIVLNANSEHRNLSAQQRPLRSTAVRAERSERIVHLGVAVKFSGGLDNDGERPSEEFRVFRGRRVVFTSILVFLSY